MKLTLTEPQARAALDALNYRLETADPAGDGWGWCGTPEELAAINAARAIKLQLDKTR